MHLPGPHKPNGTNSGVHVRTTGTEETLRAEPCNLQDGANLSKFRPRVRTTDFVTSTFKLGHAVAEWALTVLLKPLCKPQ